MNYAALKCAMHDNKYRDFCKILRKTRFYSREEDEILSHACFFGKARFVKALLKSGAIFDQRTSYREAILTSLKRRQYKVLDVLLDENTPTFMSISQFENWATLLLMNYFGIIGCKAIPLYEHILTPDINWNEQCINFEHCFNTKLIQTQKYIFHPLLFYFVQNFITKLKIFLNNGITNKYLLTEIIQSHPIAKEFTTYQIFNML